MNESIWERIESARERWNVLEHPFYQRWSAGELSEEELARYSGQYRHAVEAVATISATVAEQIPGRTELRSHAVEEAAHVELWDGFVEAAGGGVAAVPTAETRECVEAWTADDGVLANLARLYAIESGQPAISRTKREGLTERYGYTDGAGTAYFRVHETRDVEHTAQTRELISELAGSADEDVLVAEAESAFLAHWRLLDGV
ncbi:MAG: TenA family transcriptional regulator [Solirubrobacterales bacterium]